MTAPFKLVPVDSSILSSYDNLGKTGGPRNSLKILQTLGKMGYVHPEVADPLLKLSVEVSKAGGDFRVTECHRNFQTQYDARQKYDNWVNAGKPKPGSSLWNAATMKNSFVALPGRSGHNAGRSIDIHVGMLNFPVPSNKQLDRFWEIAKPLGWTPVIGIPDEGASESWHFDYWGELQPFLNRAGYEQAALCGAILVGHGGFAGYEAELQALLCRAGYSIGKIDGVIGGLTIAAVSKFLGCDEASAKFAISSKDKSLIDKLVLAPVR